MASYRLKIFMLDAEETQRFVDAGLYYAADCDPAVYLETAQILLRRFCSEDTEADRIRLAELLSINDGI